MDISNTLIIILLCIGAVQGTVFGIILIRSKNNQLANRLLATILFFLSYRLIVQIMRLFGIGYYDDWYYIMLDMSWVTGCLLYFYVRAQTIPNFKISSKDWIHFLPLFIQIVFSVFVRLQNLYWDGTKESLSWLGYWGYVVWMNNSTIYIVASILIISYSVYAMRLLSIKNENVEIDPKRIEWLKRIIRSFQFYFTLVLLVLLTDLVLYKIITENWYFYFDRFYYYPFFIGLSVLTYWIGLEGFKRKDLDGLTLKSNIPKVEKEYLEEISAQLSRLMKEKKYFKEPQLTLQTLADKLNVKPYQLSRCFKEILGTKFFDYINNQRIEEVKNMLNQPDNNKFTLLSLALEAGFNSKSSFNRAVKKHLGISPSELKSSS